MRNLLYGRKTVLIADRCERGWVMVWRSMKEDELVDNSDDDQERRLVNYYALSNGSANVVSYKVVFVVCLVAPSSLYPI